MAKVKKTTVVTGVRNVKASKKTSKKTSNRASKRPSTKLTSRVIAKARAKAAKARIQARQPVVRVNVKALEPQAKCGAGTSVLYLFRVDETVDGRTKTHLVFFDRHGWYCEDGRNCPAVEHAKKYKGHIARAS